MGTRPETPAGQETADPATMDILETVLKALADRTRLRILALLVGDDVCVCHIHDSLELPQPTVSRHLAYLRRAGLVEGRRNGLWVHYRLASLPSTVVATVVDTVTHCASHVPQTARDRARLTRLTGGAAPTRDRRQALGCCASDATARSRAGGGRASS